MTFYIKVSVMKGKLVLLTSLLTSFILLFYVATGVRAENPKEQVGRGPLTKITFIHYKKAFAKPPWAGGNNTTAVKCYGFLARGAKWKIQEPYYVNPTDSGLSSSFVENAVTTGVGEWENYAGNVFGNGNVDASASYNEGNLDGVNTASFGSYPDNAVIAVTNVWGYFGGPPQTRELVEWDMLFNNSSEWTWGDGLNDPTLMDVQNIATHELGHSFGMADLYDTSCNLETMYGYSTEGETSKRDLNSGDIQGIQELY